MKKIVNHSNTYLIYLSSFFIIFGYPSSIGEGYYTFKIKEKKVMTLVKQATSINFSLEKSNESILPKHVQKHVEELLNLNDIPNTNIQMLSEWRVWDWGVQAIGQTSQEQWNFCDRIPLSTESGIFVSGSQSFSENYNTFLNLIDTNIFKPLSILEKNKADNIDPEQQQIKQGWTNVQYTSGPNVLERAWDISSNSFEWKNKVQNGAKVTLNISNEPVLYKNDSTKNKDKPLILNNEFKIKAEKFGVITVSPNLWYNGSIVTLAKHTPYIYLSNFQNEMFFGRDGLINSRVASFIVALNPSILIDSKINVNSVHSSDSGYIESLGLKFGNHILPSFPSKIQSNVNNSNEVQLNVKASNTNQIYIIAVCVEQI